MMFSSLLLALLATSTYGLRVPFERRAPRGASLTSPTAPFRYTLGASSGEKETIGNSNDMRYTTNVTVNGVEVTVLLDTGSTDLWVIPPGGIGVFNDTGISIQLLYGDGSYGASGTIGVSPVLWGTYSIEKQAFMNAVQSTVDLQQNQIYGVLGLSFDHAIASPINAEIQQAYGEDATWGHSVLRNIFDQNPGEPNFIAVALSRTDDLEDTSGGSFTIGEYDGEEHAQAVQSAPVLPQFPVGGSRWTVLMEGVFVDQVAVELNSAMSGVPAGNVQTLLDTGNPTATVPIALMDAIYSKVPGAVQYNDGSNHLWIMPCNTTTNVELVFGGVRCPIHPLDLSTFSQPITINGQDWISCISSINGIDNFSSDFDLALGDTFLRNVYSVYDFGDANPDGSVGEPHIQLVPTTDPATAKQQVRTIRSATMANMPPEMDPATLVGFLTSSSSTPSDSGSGSANADSPDNAAAAEADGSGSAALPAPTETHNTLAAGVDTNGVNINIDKSEFKKYGLIVIILLALNCIIGLVLIAFGVLACIRRGSSKRSSSGRSAPLYVPVKTSGDHASDEYGGYQKPYSQ